MRVVSILSLGLVTVALLAGCVEETQEGEQPPATSPFPSQFARADAVTGSTSGGSSSAVSDIRITSAKLAQSEVALGESFHVNVDARNHGSARGNITLALYIDDSFARSTVLTLEAGASDSREFQTISPSRGTHSIRVNAVPAGNLVVYKPATFEIEAFDLDDSTPDNHAPVAATLRIRNTGDRAGSSQVSIRAEAVELASRNLDLAPNGVSADITASFEIQSEPVDVNVYLDGIQAAVRQATPLLPDFVIEFTEKPWNPDSSCYNEAQAGVKITNRGPGTGRAVTFQTLIDGTAKPMHPGGGYDYYRTEWNVGTLKSGESWSDGAYTIDKVTDRCGESDRYTARLYVVDQNGERDYSPEVVFTV